MTFRKRPLEVEAQQWHGSIEQAQRIVDWAGPDVIEHDRVADVLVVKTPEGYVVAQQFDYIVQGIAGEFYPCKPDIFEASYEEV